MSNISGVAYPLKQKYRNAGRLLHRTNCDPPEGTWVYSRGVSAGRAKKGGNSGGVGRVARRRLRWPEGVKQRRKAI